MLLAPFILLLLLLLVVYILAPRLVLDLRPRRPEIHPTGIHCLGSLNGLIHVCAFIPVFLRVYAIGVIETITTVLWKRGWLGTQRHTSEETVDNIVRDYIDSHPRPGRVALITGGDSGIGLQIVCGLLRAGFHVILACRTQTTANIAIKHLDAMQLPSTYTIRVVDLLVLEDVRAFTQLIKDTVQQGVIELLINNAGVMNTPYYKTQDGLESQHQINCVAPLLLTINLLPWLHRQSRILFASSSTLYTVNDLCFDRFKASYTWDGLTPYAHSKLCLALLAQHLGQRLLENSEMHVYTYHPGTVRTALFAHTTVFRLPFFSWLFDYIMLSPREGAITPLHLCLMPEELKGGERSNYWADTVPQRIPAHDTEPLWDAIMDMLEINEKAQLRLSL
ncbi:hypothetical protein BCR43DRAFT_472122 [Syncephalastrum racemosum]|uniref:NAD(P)-binding protein n=1 Tax=Syncephalastrum racemosum TaxID=13706 RepID=A0A1X2HK06_SYNRA|nr:hypothetical protein BCR43DRAFT_472122 [Syncephalastrum racemosum]